MTDTLNPARAFVAALLRWSPLDPVDWPGEEWEAITQWGIEPYRDGSWHVRQPGEREDDTLGDFPTVEAAKAAVVEWVLAGGEGHFSAEANYASKESTPLDAGLGSEVPLIAARTGRVLVGGDVATLPGASSPRIWPSEQVRAAAALGGIIHDSILVEVPHADVEAARARLTALMAKTFSPGPAIPPIQFAAEAPPLPREWTAHTPVSGRIDTSEPTVSGRYSNAGPNPQYGVSSQDRAAARARGDLVDVEDELADVDEAPQPPMPLAGLRVRWREEDGRLHSELIPAKIPATAANVHLYAPRELRGRTVKGIQYVTPDGVTYTSWPQGGGALEDDGKLSLADMRGHTVIGVTWDDAPQEVEAAPTGEDALADAIRLFTEASKAPTWDAEEGIKLALERPTLRAALAFVSLWECERVIPQAHAFLNGAVPRGPDGQGWETMFDHLIGRVLAEWKPPIPAQEEDPDWGLAGPEWTVHSIEAGVEARGYVLDEASRERFWHAFNLGFPVAQAVIEAGLKRKEG